MSEGIPVRLEAQDLAVRTANLRKRYGHTRALDGLDLTVPTGSFYLLVGTNGAGKTTTLRLLLDLVRADAGTAEVFGTSTLDARARAHIGYIPERYDEPYAFLRVGELLRHHAAYFPAWDTQYSHDLCRRMDIEPAARFGRLSKGQARRVQIVLALAHRPPLLLFDEPTDGLDPMARDDVLGLLAEHLAENPTTVLVSTHLVYEMDRLADHVGVIRRGVLAAQVQRDQLHARMRSYTLEVPDGWRDTAAIGHTVLRLNGGVREPRWIVWGAEQEVITRFAAAGARVRAVGPVSLEEAARVLLAQGEAG